MTWRGRFEPRDRMVAATVAMGFTCTASALALPLTALTSELDGPLAWFSAYVIPAGVAVASLLLHRWRRRVPALVWTLVPLVGLVLLAIIDIATRDASAGTQILFFLPVLYAGSQLRAAGAYGTAVATGVAEAVVVFSLEGTARAVTDASYVTGVLIAMTWLLVTAADRQERLVGLLRRQADVDPLTGLASRRVLTEAVGTALATAGRRGTAFLLIDVDEFKVINDTHGHLIGDETLIHLGRLLEAQFESAGVVCRLGGDELAVLLPDCGYAAAVEAAEQLVRTVGRSPVPGIHGTGLPFSISVGVGQVPGGPADDASELYSRADVSLYEAKRAGRGRVGRSPAPAPSGTTPSGPTPSVPAAPHLPPQPRGPGGTTAEPVAAPGSGAPDAG